MRLSNDRDQALIRSAVSDAGASLLTFVPSLGTGEVFAFGAGVALPTRMNFRELPRGTTADQRGRRQHPSAAGALPDRDMIDSVIERWRASTMSHRAGLDDDVIPTAAACRRAREDIAPSAPRTSPPLQPAHHRAASRRPPTCTGRACLRRPGCRGQVRTPARSADRGNPAPLPSRYRPSGTTRLEARASTAGTSCRLARADLVRKPVPHVSESVL